VRYVPVLVVSVCTALTASQSPSARPRGDGRISGRILTPSGAPIVDADVAALYFTQEPRGEHIYSARSQRDGGYEIAGVPAGRIRVIVRKAGYSNMRTDPARLGEGTLVDLAAGGSVTGIDLVMAATGSIAGRVLRPDGTPVARATVAVQVRRPSGQLIGVQPPLLTGADGSYRLENVPQGSYVIVASYTVKHEMMGKPIPAEYVDWARTFHPSARTFEDATRVTVSGGDTHSAIDVVLQPDPRFTLSGTVVDERGETPPGVRVQYGSDHVSGGGDTTSDAGTFSIRDLASGPVHLLVSANGVQAPLLGFATIEVQGASIVNARLTVGAPGTVRGRLIGEGVDVPRDPPLRVRFELPWQRFSRNGAELDAFPVSPEGTFEVREIIGPRTVDLLGLPPQLEVKAVRHGGRALPDARLIVTNGQVVDDLELVVGARN
jgi:hypothetical protein